MDSQIPRPCPRSFSSHHLSMGSIMVVDSPGFQSPRHEGKERAATFEELCHNYVHERLQLLYYQRTFVSTLERHREVGQARLSAGSHPPPGVFSPACWGHARTKPFLPRSLLWPCLAP